MDLVANCFMIAINIKHTRAHKGLTKVYFLKNQRKVVYDEMTKLIEKALKKATWYEKRAKYCDLDEAKSHLSMTT